MKHNLLQIKNTNNGLKIIYTKELFERVKSKCVPNKLGFYRYPSTMNKEEAFKELKQFLIDDVEKEINRLKEYMKELKNLKLED